MFPVQNSIHKNFALILCLCLSWVHKECLSTKNFNKFSTEWKKSESHWKLELHSKDVMCMHHYLVFQLLYHLSCCSVSWGRISLHLSSIFNKEDVKFQNILFVIYQLFDMITEWNKIQNIEGRKSLFSCRF